MKDPLFSGINAGSGHRLRTKNSRRCPTDGKCADVLQIIVNYNEGSLIAI